MLQIWNIWKTGLVCNSSWWTQELLTKLTNIFNHSNPSPKALIVVEQNYESVTFHNFELADFYTIWGILYSSSILHLIEMVWHVRFSSRLSTVRRTGDLEIKRLHDVGSLKESVRLCLWPGPKQNKMLFCWGFSWAPKTFVFIWFGLLLRPTWKYHFKRFIKSLEQRCMN